MTTDPRRPGSGGAMLASPPTPESLDYYLILPQTAGGGTPGREPSADPEAEPAARPEAVVVEELVLAEDGSAVGLDSAGWSPGAGGWWSSAASSRAMRTDPDLRRRVAAVDRQAAQSAYRQLGGGALPEEEALRSHFRDRAPLATSAPLRLTPTPQDKRVYRILFANELSPYGLANLGAAWQMRIDGDGADPQARIVGTAHLRINDAAFTWELRRVGPGVAWCLDLTADLGGGSGDVIRPLLRGLTTLMRRQGLLPVTIERFS
jgi:hypothetical protein